MIAPWTVLEDVTAESGANNDGSSSNDRPNLKFNPEFNPNALVGKATCIQLKPAGRSCVTQSYVIKSAPWTILWFRILVIFSVENIKRLCVFMFQT